MVDRLGQTCFRSPGVKFANDDAYTLLARRGALAPATFLQAQDLHRIGSSETRSRGQARTARVTCRIRIS